MFLLILIRILPRKIYLNFTFQYVSINTNPSGVLSISRLPLHSNMFLLIPARLCWSHWKEFTLHSNMFLLIRYEVLILMHLQRTLHSNMFLLILLFLALAVLVLKPLHSNMFLLIPVGEPKEYSFRLVFTFQYVSINTIVQQSESGETPLFTFQYVSINTRSSEPPINSSILYHILSTMVFFYLFIYFDITRFTGSTILLMFFTFVDLS